MFWRRVSLIAGAFLASTAGGQPPGDAAAVDRLIQEAFSRNREILAVEQRVAEARGLLRQAGVRPVPTIETNGGSGRPLFSMAALDKRRGELGCADRTADLLAQSHTPAT